MGVSRNIKGSYKIPLPRRKQVCFCGERGKCFCGDVFDLWALNVQKPRDIITGLRYSESCR